MSNVIRNLIIKVGADLSEFDKSLKAMSKELKSAGKEITATGKSLTKGLTTPVLGAATALTALAVNAGNNADELLTLSQKTGISTQRLQELAYASRFVDVEMETMTGSMAKQIKSQKAAQDGTKLSVDAYKKLGVEYKNADGTLRDSQEVYWEVIDALGGMTNETERDALAMQLMGKSAQDLNPLIKAGSDELTRLSTEAHNVGAVLSDETITSLGKFDDSMEKMQAQLQTASAQVGAAFLPVLEKLMPVLEDKIIPAIMKFADWIGSLIDKFDALDPGTQKFILGLAGALVALGPVLTVIGKLTTGLGGVVGTLAKVAKGITGGAGLVSSLGTLIGPAGIVILSIAAIAGLALAIKGVIDRNNELFTEVNKVKDAHKELNNSIEKADENYRLETDSINANALEAQMLTARLTELDAQTQKTTGDKAEYASIVERLNTLYPNLNAFIDEETGKINLSTEAILSNIDAMKEKALAAVIQERLTEKVKAYAEASIELEKAEKKVTDSEELLRVKQIELQNTYTLIAASMGLTNDEFDKLDANTRGQALASSQYRDRLNELKDDIGKLTITLPALKKAKDDLAVSVDNTKTAIQEETIAVRNAVNSLQDFGKAGANAGEALAQGMFSKVGAVRAAAQALADAAVVKVKNTLEIKSPSKVFQRLGEMATKGFALGIDDLMQGTKDFAQMASPQLATAGYSSANIVVNLDGKVLARAIGQPLTDNIRVKTGIR